MTILITGGAGYIGRHVVRALLERGSEVVVADLPGTARFADVPHLETDLASDSAGERLARFATDHGVDAIVHLAARKRVDESVRRPAWYYRQNIGGLVGVLEAAEQTGVRRIVFSSTAAVYASADAPVTEDDGVAPTNPYGESKLAGERLIEAFAHATGARAIGLRYFNVAGAAGPELAETQAYNLIPLTVGHILAGEPPVIYGDDYPTPDGTCVRDYIHVDDLVAAHLAALNDLGSAGAPWRVYNVGTGSGASVREVSERLLELAGSSLRPVVAARREGDPPVVVADPSRIRRELGWEAARDLDEVLRSAWTSR